MNCLPDVSPVFSTPSQPNYNINVDTSVCLNKITFTVTEVFNTLSELDISKCCGPDLIPSSVLRNCRTLFLTLYRFFSTNLRDDVFPDVVKLGPIYKAGNREDVANYRPIVIQSAVVKVLEKLVVTKLNPIFRNIISSK